MHLLRYLGGYRSLLYPLPLPSRHLQRCSLVSLFNLLTMLLQPRLLPRFLSISTKPFFSPFSPRAAHLTTIPLPIPSPPILSPIIPDSDPDLSIQNPITLPLQKLFVPPETDLSGGDTKSAHSRVLTGSKRTLFVR